MGEEFDEDDLITSLVNFLLKQYPSELRIILEAEDESLHYGLEIEVPCLVQRMPKIIEAVLYCPDKLLPVFNEAVFEAQKIIQKENDNLQNHAPKILCHARLCNLPPLQECNRPTVSAIRCKDARKMIVISGTVIRTGSVKMLEAEREYQCTRCKHRFRVFSDLEQNSVIELPKTCPSPQDGKKKPCKSQSFNYVEGSHVCRDYQEIKIQEIVQKLTVGSIPRSMMVVCHDDLVDKCQAGDDITIAGVVRQMWNPFVRDKRCEVELFIEANHIRVNNDTKSTLRIDEDLKKEFEEFWIDHQDRPLEARNFIVSGICPQLYGLFMYKLSVALTIIGGVRRIDSCGSKIRGENHLLIVGDPGTGKSQLLRYAAKLTNRSVLTTGIGTSSAGLTVAAVKDKGGDWALEAGALVLADGGICCIDEFGCVREHDRVTIHEAMEQQTLSVAKAGLVCKLNTRTTIFAVMNPKGAYDVQADLSVNCAIASPLLSRFDLILLMLDSQNEEWDRKVSQHIMESQPRPNAVGVDLTQPAPWTQVTQGISKKKKKPWPLEKMQAYIHYVKTSFTPQLSRFSEQILLRYYQEQRQTDYRNAARTTIRLLESLIRLAQAHAKLMFRDTVFPQDAIAAIILVESSMESSGVTDRPSALHMIFEENPDSLFKKREKQILQQLDLGKIPRNERFYSYYAHLRQGASRDVEIMTPLSSEISQGCCNPSNQVKYQVLVRKNGVNQWCDLESCVQAGNGKYDVKVANTKEAVKLGIANSTCSQIEESFIREIEENDGNGENLSQEVGADCKEEYQIEEARTNSRQKNSENESDENIDRNSTVQSAKQTPKKRKENPETNEQKPQKSRRADVGDDLEDMGILDDLDVNLEIEDETGEGFASSPINFT